MSLVVTSTPRLHRWRELRSFHRTMRFIKSMIALLVSSLLFLWSIGTRTWYLDYYTGSMRTEYRFGPVYWRCAEKPQAATAWAKDRMMDPDRRLWVNGCSGSIFPFNGVIGCGMPADTVLCIWRSDLPETKKVELLLDWYSTIEKAPDLRALRTIEGEWFECNADTLGLER